MRAIKTFHAAAWAGSLALIAMATPCTFGQAQQEDAATSTTAQQQGPTLEQLQKQIDELQKQINILKNAGANSPEARQVTTGKASTPAPVAMATVAKPAPVTPAPGSATNVPESATSGSNNPHSEPFAFADFTWLN